MLRLSEMYPSYQGEGPNTGAPTTFIRFAGCNLKCPGWPCDTPHAIDPRIFTKEQEYITPTTLAGRALAIGTPNYCLTGGEPLIQDQGDLLWLVRRLTLYKRTVEVFTNGTRIIAPELMILFKTVILDWKLPGSGEKIEQELDDNRRVNLNLMNRRGTGVVKFTVANLEEDFDWALDYSRLISDIAPRVPIICGPVWGVLDPAKLAAKMLQLNLPWRLTLQTHKYIWDPDARRT